MLYGMVIVGGKTFSDEILERITETVQAEPAISRRQLSLRVCDWMGWRNQAQRPQEMSCRKALLELHRMGRISLPEVTRQYAFREARQCAAPPPVAAVCCSLSDLGEVEIVRVRPGALSALWRGLMDAHHYLKSGPLCGAQLRYLAHSERFGWIGGLSYSACARRVESRDAWIGWTEDARCSNHILLVNNSRFLIPPTVRVKNLASHLLALAQRRLASDWEAVYKYRPVLLETYVERGRFAGTCYRAANWTYVGTTGGRGRQGSGATIKDIYVMPLTAAWQTALCRRSDGTVQVRRKTQTPPKDWIEAELGETHLGDTRLTARLLQMTGMFYARPTANIPQACGSVAAAKAAYRFLDNEAVDWRAILEAHYKGTEERLREKELVLVVQDTTTLNYSSHPNTKDLGPIGTNSEKVRGLMVHDTMVFTPEGTPLGLLNVQCWAREGIGSRHERYQKPIEEKESWKWVESYQAVSAVQKRNHKTQLVLVSDRESDIHELFAEQAQTPHGAQLLIRAERSRNRKAYAKEGEDYDFLWPLLEEQDLAGTREILVPPSEKRAARQAKLAVRTLPIVLRAPKRKPHLPAVRLWAVLAQEVSPPAEVEGLEWMLLSTVEVKNKEDAYEKLEWYARRWGIEIYHRIMKSGCRVEARQLENATRLQNCLAIDMIVAWRIHYLTTLGQKTPEVPCTVYFTDSEWKALTTFTNRTKKPPQTPPSLNESVRLLGKLGGHLGRVSDGHPGAEVLWRGMARLADIEIAYDLYH
ncbi:MAG: IS4 family transposase [Chloroflexota bacterium]